VLSHSLCDTHLQPSDLPMGFLPVNGTPLLSVVSECTSLLCRHLLPHLQRFYKFSRNETPVGRLHALSPGLETYRFWRWAIFMPYLSAFPKAFASSNLSHPPLHRRALRFACLELLPAKDGVTTALSQKSFPGYWQFKIPRGFYGVGC